MSKTNIYNQNLDQNKANFAALTPLSFLERAASVYPDHCSIIHGETRYTWSQTWQRCCRLASALIKLGIEAIKQVRSGTRIPAVTGYLNTQIMHRVAGSA